MKAKKHLVKDVVHAMKNEENTKNIEDGEKRDRDETLEDMSHTIPAGKRVKVQICKTETHRFDVCDEGRNIENPLDKEK